MNVKRAVLAAAAAALFSAGVTLGAGATSHGEEEGAVHCEGINGCKGQSECKTDASECSGKNSCKGKGWKSMSAEECEKAKAEMEDA